MPGAARFSRFPLLPTHLRPPDGWSHNVQAAHALIAEACNQAIRVLRQDDADPLRLRVIAKSLQDRVIPVLGALSADDSISLEWAETSAHCLGSTVQRLYAAAEAVRDVERQKWRTVSPIQSVEAEEGDDSGQQRGRGRPRKAIDRDWLSEAISPHRKISIQKISDILKVNRSTTYRYMRRYGFQRCFTNLTDEDLDLLIRTYKVNKPNAGLRFVSAFLRIHGFRIQKTRIRNSIRRVDGLGQVLRRRIPTTRRQYRVPRSNHLWHGDGHHKLIQWGIVIHGFIDGFDHTVTGLRASNDNRASTVLDLFKESESKFGLPSRVRGDRGGENVEVSVYMIMRRGPNRASFMWGSSTRNSRIERLWVDVGVQFARRWRAFFLRLERLHDLDRGNPHHLWLLHQLFLNSVNIDCQMFQQEWNNHSIRGPNTNDKTPLDIRFLAAVEHGIYIEVNQGDDDFDDVDPELLNRYYGVDRPSSRRPGQTGAGHPPDEEIDDDSSNTDEDLRAQITSDQQPNIRHDAIEVPSHDSPFPTIDMENCFRQALSAAREMGTMPENMNLFPEEWEEDGYPTTEDIPLGARGQKILTVELPADLWYPRARLWCQALELMEYFKFRFSL